MAEIALITGISSALNQPRLGLFGTLPGIGPLGPSIDNPLVRPRRGQRIGDMRMQGTAEGSPQNRCFGPKNRVAGALVWMSDLKEVKKTESGGGKAGGGSGGEFITYQYFAHMLVHVCRALTPISGIPMIWANGKLIFNSDADVEISSSGIDTYLASAQVYAGGSFIGGGTTVTRNYMIMETDVALSEPDLSIVKSGNTATVAGFTGGSLPGAGNMRIVAAPTIGATVINIRTIAGTQVLNAGDVLEFAGFSMSYSVKSPGATLTTAGVNVPIENTIVAARPIATVAAPVAVTAKRGAQANNGTFAVVSATKDPDPSGTQLSQVKLTDQSNPYRLFVAVTAGTPLTVSQANPTFKSSQVGEVTIMRGGPDQAVWSVLQNAEGGTVSQVYAMRNKAGIGLTDINLTDFGNMPPNLEELVEVTPDAGLVADAIKTILVEDADWPESGIDVSGVTGQFDGFVVEGPTPPRESIGVLVAAFDLAQWERGGKLYFADRASLEQLSIPASEVGSYVQKQEKRSLEIEDPPRDFLPSAVEVSYRSPTKEYQTATKRSMRSEDVPVNIVPVDLSTGSVSLVIEDARAQQLADRFMASMWGTQRRLTAPLPQSRAGVVHEGMILNFTGTIYGQTWRMLVDRVDRGAGMLVIASGQEFDPSLLEQTQETEGSLGISASGNMQDGGHVQPLADLILLDVPALRDEDRFEPGIYGAARSLDPQRAWRGGILYWSRDDGVQWNRVAEIPTEAVTGELISGPDESVVPGMWDHVNTIRVRVRHTQAQLGSVSKDACLAGANRFLVGGEIIGACDVIFVSRDVVDGSSVYDLSTLLRGQQDTEQEMETHVADEAVVWLDGPGIVFIQLGFPHVDMERLWRLVPHGGHVEDALEIRAAPRARNCRPFHVEAEGTRDGSNNLTIKLWRTSRAAVDPFEQGQPLDEEVEKYEVDIVFSGSVVRTLTVEGDSEVVYSAADQTTDGITPGDPVTLRPYQISAALLRGAESEYEV